MSSWFCWIDTLFVQALRRFLTVLRIFYKYYFTVNDQRALTNIQTVSNGPRVGLSDGSMVQGSQAGYVKLHPALTSHAQKAHIFPGIKSSSLISIGKLCDDGCTTVLNNKEIGIYKNNTIILRCKRNFTDGLRDITIPTPDSLPTSSYVKTSWKR